MDKYQRSNTTGVYSYDSNKITNKVTIINKNNLKSKVDINSQNIIIDTQKIIKPIASLNKPKYQKQISSDNTFKNFDEFKIKPTAKLRNVKLADPFSSKQKHVSNFGYTYSAGGIPCHIQHGNVQMKIKWDKPIETIDYDSILIICFEGLIEMDHPYKFASRQCTKELLQMKGAYEKVVPLLPKAFVPLRAALGNSIDEVFLDACDIIIILSDLVKEKLNQYISYLLQAINKRICNGKYKEKALTALNTLEKNGGEEALKTIKTKIPTYIGGI